VSLNTAGKLFSTSKTMLQEKSTMALQIVNICGGGYRENNKEICFKNPYASKIDRDTTVALQK